MILSLFITAGVVAQHPGPSWCQLRADREERASRDGLRDHNLFYIGQLRIGKYHLLLRPETPPEAACHVVKTIR